MQVSQRFEAHLLILLQHRPRLHTQALQTLQQLSAEHGAHAHTNAQRVFWCLTTRLWDGLAQAAKLDTTHIGPVGLVLQGLRLQGQSQHTDLQALNPLLFLEQADGLTRQLANALQARLSDPESWPSDLSILAQQLMLLAQDMGLDAVIDLARALRSQLQRIDAQRDSADLQISLLGVQEIMRLLHQFAAGASLVPNPQRRMELDASG